MSALLHCYQIGPTVVEVWEDNVVTRFDDGSKLTAAPNAGEDMRDTIDHEVAHTYLAWLYKGDASVALWCAANPDPIWDADAADHVRLEEEAVCSFVLGLRARRGDHRRPWDQHEIAPNSKDTP